MKILIKEYNKPFFVADVDNTLEALQELVGGYIEVFPVTEDVLIICNEDGKLKNLPYNITVNGEPLVGNLIVCGEDGEEFTDVPDEVMANLVCEEEWTI